jgi:hypothetical protein
MSNQFPIFEVPEDAAEASEAMGSRFKFWFHHPDLGNCLFKQVRSNTGEDWSEKIAAELAELLGLPHANYALATWREHFGVISSNFLTDETVLIHGNDILAGLVSSYPRSQIYSASQHTLDVVLDALRLSGLKLPLNWSPPEGITEAVSVFVGYWLLDAWICNGDRHHENWGFMIQMPQGIPYLAPTYDHASCLGRELLDLKRRNYLQSNTVNNYVEKSRSAFYHHSSDRRAMLTFDLFEAIARKYPTSAKIWLDQLAKVPMQAVESIFRQIPAHRISSLAVEFSLKMLEINQLRLLNLRDRRN